MAARRNEDGKITPLKPTSRKRKRTDAEDFQEQPFYTRASASLLADTEPDPKEKKSSASEEKMWEAMFQHCESRWQSLYTWRVPVWTTWGQIARYELPRRFYAFVTGNQFNLGLRQDFAIVDRTATLAGGVCAAGLMAGLTEPDRPWLKLGPAIPGFELDKAGEVWFDDLTERLRYIYANSNFYESLAQHYEDLVFFANAPVIDYEDADDIINCVTPCAGEYCLGSGFDNQDEVFYREFRQTVNQTVEMFGIDNCPSDVQQMWRQKGGALQYENVIGHAIESNFAILGEDDKPVGKLPHNLPWREIYWMRGKKGQKALSVTGFHEKPFAVSRWNTQGNEAYARGIGEDMLGDTIQLQLETRQKAESIEKVNRPPMGADVSLMNQPSSINPGKITFMNTNNGGEKKFFPLYEVRPDIPAITADIMQVQLRIRDTAYNNVFRMMEDLRDKTRGAVTATEIDALREERLMQLGPVIGRIYGALRQRVHRHLAIMARRGLIPPKPDSLRGVPLRVEFVSMLTAAQKANQTQAIARVAQFAGSLSGAYPTSRFVFDPDEAIREFADDMGAPARTIRAPREVQKMVQAEVQQQKAAQAMQVTQAGAAAAGALGKASVLPDTALGALVGATGNAP